jgi:hypothetical protein
MIIVPGPRHTVPGPPHDPSPVLLAVQHSVPASREPDRLWWIAFEPGTGSATIGADEEASLVVVNTPDVLYMYDRSKIGTTESSDPASVGLDYEVQMTGATPAD